MFKYITQIIPYLYVDKLLTSVFFATPVYVLQTQIGMWPVYILYLLLLSIEWFVMKLWTYFKEKPTHTSMYSSHQCQSQKKGGTYKMFKQSRFLILQGFAFWVFFVCLFQMTSLSPLRLTPQHLPAKAAQLNHLMCVLPYFSPLSYNLINMMGTGK